MRVPSDARSTAAFAAVLSFSVATVAFAQARPDTPEAPTAADASAAPSTTAPSGAAPQPGEARSLADSLTGESKRDYELGRLLYDNGDYAGALARFEKAHEASGDARLSWNAAVCQKALHHYAKAIASMRSFLASSALLVTPAAAASARNFLAAAEPLTAHLDVSANVSGSLVYADGESMGSTPLSEDARIDWGAHQIVVKKRGYTDYEQTVSVASSADVRVLAVLRPVVHEGRIVVRADSGDLIAVDGEVRAWGTWEGVLPSGDHALRVSAAGFRPHEQRVVVADAQTRGFDITLQRSAPSRLPTWVWLAGGAALAAGAVTAGYFIFKPGDSRPPFEGSLGTVQLGLH
jgi:hypothetical protein